jgi:uncharacterized membrane protein YphA (DoxX/SURF4 family)
MRVEALARYRPMTRLSNQTAMIAERSTATYGWRAYGLGVIALGIVCLAFGDFHPGQPVPKDFPLRATLAYAAATLMLVSGLLVEWRRTAPLGAAVLSAYFVLVVVLLMNGRVLLAHYAEFAPYESTAIELAIALAGLIVFATSAGIDAALSRRLVRGAQIAFGICALVFGTAHFVYMDLTAPLVPRWLPPSQEFWACATGLFHLAAGIAILTGVQARLAAILLTVMFASFTPLVHIPTLFADPSNRWFWNENAVNLALVGAAWVVADSLGRKSAEKAL